MDDDWFMKVHHTIHEIDQRKKNNTNQQPNTLIHTDTQNK